MSEGESETTRLQGAARASSYYRTAEFFAPFDSPERKALFDAARGAFRRSLPIQPVEVSVIAVPDGDVEYDGYVFHGRGASASNRGPGVVLLGGADSYAEELFYFGGCALAQRGITVVVADTPGRGSTIRHKGIVSRPDYEVPAARVLDFLCELPGGRSGAGRRGRREPRRLLRAAARGLRRAGEGVRLLVRLLRRARGHLRVLRADPPADRLDRRRPPTTPRRASGSRASTSRDVAGQIRCPILISHGERDSIMAVQSARHLYDAVGSEDKRLRIWSESEGGADHCNYDAWAECIPFMFDWLLERL